MKELSIEEKAKRYESALERCRKLYKEAKANEYTSDIEDYETIFPELKETGRVIQGQRLFKSNRTMIKNEQERQRIGNEIATLRKEKGMTQQNLADRVEMQRAHIARIEAGRYSVGLDTLTAIGKALGKRLAFV